MRADTRVYFALLILLVLVSCGPKRPAPDPLAGLHRCQSPSGDVVYSDDPCPSASPGRARLAVTVPDPPGCIRRTPHGSLWQRVVVMRAGVIEQNTMVVRNRDSCACPAQCFRVTTGLHTPPTGWTMCSLNLDGRRFKLDRPSAFCLTPGEEWKATVSTKLADWSARHCAVWTAHDVARADWDFMDRTTSYMEIEGDAYCGPDTPTQACATLVYERAPEF